MNRFDLFVRSPRFTKVSITLYSVGLLIVIMAFLLKLNQWPGNIALMIIELCTLVTLIIFAFSTEISRGKKE